MQEKTSARQTSSGEEETLIRVYTFGPLTLEWEGQTSPFPNERLVGRGVAPALGLLKALLSQPHRFASRDWLLEQFWPDSASSSAQQRLDDVVSKLRTLLRPEGSTTKIVQYVYGSTGSGSGYRLEGYPLIWVDADAFCWYVEQAARLERFGQPAVDYWERAYQLASRGAFLVEESYSDWAMARRNALAGQYRQCVHRLTALLWEAGAREEALLRLRSYWQEHITDEDALRPLMELLCEQERYQEAEEYYQQLLLALSELSPDQEGKPSTPDPRTYDLREVLRAKQIQRKHVLNNSMSTLEDTFMTFVPPTLQNLRATSLYGNLSIEHSISQQETALVANSLTFPTEFIAAGGPLWFVLKQRQWETLTCAYYGNALSSNAL